MERKSGVLPFLLIALIAGGALFPHLVERGPAQPGVQSVSSTSASQTSLIGGLEPGTEQATGAVDLLADFLGLDGSDEALRRAALSAAKELTNPTSLSSLRDDVQFLGWFLDLDLTIKATGLEAVRSTAGELSRQLAPTFRDTIRPIGQAQAAKEFSNQRAASLKALGSFIDAYLNQEALKIEHPENRDKLIALDFASLDKEPLLRRLVRRTALRRGVSVRFLVATVPDPIDSSAGWQFDTMVDAIQSAAGASGYVLDRFYIPDLEAEGKASAPPATARRRLHERWPGVILFRNTAETETLVVLLVSETPTFGVHQASFVRAVHLVKAWDGKNPSEIAVLGPTFSGSSKSLKTALQNLSGELADSHVRFISGSATSRSNQGTLQDALPTRVTFRATVPPDDVALWFPYEHIVGQNPTFTDRVAVLQEGNTDYGSKIGAWSPIEQLNVKRIQFPIHISRLRAGATAERTNSEAAKAAQRFRALSLEELVTPTDQLPAPSFKTTSSYVELVLANLLDTIRSEDVAAVGLFATDSRDKLFLAQQIALNYPNILLFTNESDLLYAHPDYATYMTGVLVASAYPLYNGNQLWSAPFNGTLNRSQFPTSAAQGIYNAVIALLNYREQPDGLGVPIHPNAPPLLEYADPGATCDSGCWPPVWLSVVSRGAIWPIKINPLRYDGYMFRASIATDPKPASAQTIFPSTAARLLFMLLTSIVAVHIVGCSSIARGIPTRQTAAPQSGTSDLATAAATSQSKFERFMKLIHGATAASFRRYLLVCILSLFLAYGFLTGLLAIWVSNEPAALSGAFLLAVTLLAGLGLCVVWLVWSGLLVPLGSAMKTMRGNWHTYLKLKNPETRAGLRCVSVGLVVVVLCGWGTRSLVHYLGNSNLVQGWNGMLLVERAAHLGNGVSPIVPVLLLAAALYLWGAIELARLWLPRAPLTCKAPIDEESTNKPTTDTPPPLFMSLVGRCAIGGVEDLKNKLCFIDGSILEVPPWGLLVVAVVGVFVLTFAFNPWSNPLATIEGLGFNKFVTSFILVLHFTIALALVQFIYRWRLLKEILRRLSAHPMIEAYSRLPRTLLPRSIFPRQPRLLDLQPTVEGYRTLVSDGHGPALSDLADAQRVAGEFQSDLRTRSRWSESTTWASVVKVAESVSHDLVKQWATAPSRSPKSSAPRLKPISITADWNVPEAVLIPLHGISGEDQPDESLDRLQRQEEFVAMPIVLGIRDVFSRLGQNVLFIMGAILLVLCSHVLYPFQSKQRLMAFIWTDILVFVATVLTVLVQVEQNAVVSRLTSTTPGQVSWDRDFISKLVVYGLFPLLSLFAVQFPDVGGALLHWLEPVQKAIP